MCVCGQVSVNIAALVAANTSPTRSIDPAKIKARFLESKIWLWQKGHCQHWSICRPAFWRSRKLCRRGRRRERCPSPSSPAPLNISMGQLLRFRQEYQRFKRLFWRPRQCRRWRSRYTLPSSPAHRFIPLATAKREDKSIISVADHSGKNIRCARACAGDGGAGMFLLRLLPSSWKSLTNAPDSYVNWLGKVDQERLPEPHGVVQEIEEQVHHSPLNLLHICVLKLNKLMNPAGMTLTLILLQARLSEKGADVQEMKEQVPHFLHSVKIQCNFENISHSICPESAAAMQSAALSFIH